MEIITYRNHEIRFKFLEEVSQKNLKLPQTWFVSVAKIYPYEGYPYLGCHWLKTSEQCVDWGKKLINAELENGDAHSLIFEPLHPDLVAYNPTRNNFNC
jgi:hypothetical protein